MAGVIEPRRFDHPGSLIGDRFRAFSCSQKEASSVGELFRRNMFKELVHAPVRRTAPSYGRPRGCGNSSWNIRPLFPLLA